MRAVIQRVREAWVEVEGRVTGRIARGVLVFLGVGREDETADADYLAEKIPHLRIFEDERGKMNRSLAELGFSTLVVSQFTLWGDCRKGRRPSFSQAASPPTAEFLYDYFVQRLRDRNVITETGIFQALMDVHILNDGPVTLLLDSRKIF